jgi:hypothetical protein
MYVYDMRGLETQHRREGEELSGLRPSECLRPLFLSKTINKHTPILSLTVRRRRAASIHLNNTFTGTFIELGLSTSVEIPRVTGRAIHQHMV